MVPRRSPAVLRVAVLAVGFVVAMSPVAVAEPGDDTPSTARAESAASRVATDTSETSGSLDLSHVAGARFSLPGLRESMAAAEREPAETRDRAEQFRKAFFGHGKVELLALRANTLGATIEELRPVAPGDEENAAEVEAGAFQLRAALADVYEGVAPPDTARIGRVVEDLTMALQSGEGRLRREVAATLGRTIYAILAAPGITMEELAALVVDAREILLAAGCEPASATAFVESLLALADGFPAASLPHLRKGAVSFGKGGAAAGASGLKGEPPKAPGKFTPGGQ